MPRLEWEFNPARAPHRGGVWEALVKSTKRILVSLLGKGDVDIDVFRTVLTQAKSSDAADPLPLTPAHFLHLSVDAFDDPTLLQFEAAGTESLRYSYNKSINLVRGLWKRWKGEYVSSLKKQSKVAYNKTRCSNWSSGIIS